VKRQKQGSEDERTGGASSVVALQQLQQQTLAVISGHETPIEGGNAVATTCKHAGMPTDDEGILLKIEDCAAYTMHPTLCELQSITSTQSQHHKRVFDEAVRSSVDSLAQNSSLLTREDVATITSALLHFQTHEKSHGIPTKWYHYRKKYQLVLVGGARSLAQKEDTEDAEKGVAVQGVKVVVPQEDFFEAIWPIHNILGYSKIRTLHKEVSAKHGRSVPRWVCKLFTDLCPHCIKKKPGNRAKQALVELPLHQGEALVQATIQAPQGEQAAHPGVPSMALHLAQTPQQEQEVQAPVFPVSPHLAQTPQEEQEAQARIPPGIVLEKEEAPAQGT